MHINFDGGETIVLTLQQRNQFTLLREMLQTNACDSVNLIDTDSALVRDLLELHNLDTNLNPTGWMAQKMMQSRCGYVRDLFVMNLFLNSECSNVEEVFNEIFCYILSAGTEKDIKDFFGL